MKKWQKPILWVGLGLAFGFPFFSLSYYTMVRTSTPQFCASCKEIKFAYDTWSASSHAYNSFGFVADCMDCHLPAPQDTFNFFYTKTAHGIKDIALHFIVGSEEYDHQKNREKAWATIKNEQCLKCHRSLLKSPARREALLAHQAALYPAPGQEKRCLDCHRNLVHTPRYNYRERG